MRELNMGEIDKVSGAANFIFDFGFFRLEFNDAEGASVYRSAVSSMTDFFMWWDPEELLSEGS